MSPHAVPLSARVDADEGMRCTQHRPRLAESKEVDITRPRFGRDVVPEGCYRGTIVVATVWFALYVFMILHEWMFPAN